MKTEPIACAFVGALAPPEECVNNLAFSAAGHLLQERLLSSLADAGIEITQVFSLRPAASFPIGERLWYPAGRTRVAQRFGATLIPFVNLRAAKTLTSGLSLFPQLLRWVWTHRHRRRALLLYNVASPPGIVSIAAARLTRTKIFAMVADIYVPGSGFIPDTWVRRLDFRLQTRSLPLFDALIVLTRRMAQDFAPRTPHIQVEGGIPEDQPVSDESALDRLPGGSAPFVLMYSGGLVDVKGIPLLLDAFARLKGDRFRLWIAGDGPLREQVEAAAGRDPRITFHGMLPNGEVLKLYRSATLLVNPHSTTHLSARYLFPSKVIEYLATAKPTISTCSTPEVEEEYGNVLFLLHEESPEALAELVRRLARMPDAELAAVGERGRRYVLERKTWRVQGQRIAELMHRTVGSGA